MGGKSVYLNEDEGVVCRYIINCNKKGQDVTLNGVSRTTGFCSNKAKNVVTDLIERGILVTVAPTFASNKYNTKLTVKERDIIVLTTPERGFTPEQVEAMKACGITTDISPEVKAFILQEKKRKGKGMSRSDLAARLRMTKSQLNMILILLEEQRHNTNLANKLGNFKREGVRIS